MPVLDYKNMDKLYIVLYRVEEGDKFQNKIVILENYNTVSFDLVSPDSIANVFMEYISKKKLEKKKIEILTVIPLKFAEYVGFADKNDVEANKRILDIYSELKGKEVMN